MTAQEASRYRLVLAFAAIYLIWGSTYLAIRFAIETLPPFSMAGVRFVIAGVIVLAWQLLSDTKPPTRRQWRSAWIIGALLLLGGNGGVVWAEQRIDSGLAALVVATVPIWVVMLDWLRPGGHRPARRVLFGIVGGLVGMTILIGPDELAGAARMDLPGVIAVIFGSLTWSVGSLYSRTADLPGQPLLATGMQMLTGGLLLVAAGGVMGEMQDFSPEAVSARSLLALLYLIVFGSIIAFTAYAWLLRNADTAKVATYAYVNPVVALVLGWALAGEALNARSLLAASVILASVMLITMRKKVSSGPGRVAPIGGGRSESRPDAASLAAKDQGEAA